MCLYRVTPSHESPAEFRPLTRCIVISASHLTAQGASCGGDKDECIALIAESINLALKEVAETVAVLENTGRLFMTDCHIQRRHCAFDMSACRWPSVLTRLISLRFRFTSTSLQTNLVDAAGGGSSIGQTFEELKQIIDLIDDKSRIGVCLDTCHAFAAGYDITTAAGVEKFLNEFDEKIGFAYLKGMHINDSKAALGSKKDRHENIGDGEIKLECFRAIMNDKRLDDLPLILETPINADKASTLDAAEVKLLYSMIEGEDYTSSSSSSSSNGTSSSPTSNGVTA